MSDSLSKTAYNPLEMAGAIIKTTTESISDAAFLFEDAILDRCPLKLVIDRDMNKDDYKLNVEVAAEQALLHGNVNEALHQFQREVYLCHALPSSSDAVFLKSAATGMTGINEHEDPRKISLDIDRVWFDNIEQLWTKPQPWDERTERQA